MAELANMKYDWEEGRTPNIIRTHALPVLARQATLGWGFLTAWGLIGMSAHAAYTEEPISLIASIGSATNTCSFLIIAAFSIIRAKMTGHNPMQAVAAPTQNGARSRRSASTLSTVMTLLLICVGSAIPLVTQETFSLLNETALVIASIGYVVLTMAWGGVYARLDVQVIERDSIRSTLVCALSYLVAIMLPQTASMVLRTLLPVLSFACLRLALSNTRKTPPVITGTQQTSAADSRLLGWVLIAIALGATVLASPVYLAANSALADAFTQAALMPAVTLSGLVIAALLVIYYVVFAKRINFSTFFRVLCPTTALGLFLIVIPNATVAFLGYGLLLSAQWMLHLFVWIYAAELCQERRSDPLLAFAALRFAFDLGFLCSSILMSALNRHGIALGLIALGLCAAFSLTTLLPIEDRQTEEDEFSADTDLENLERRRFEDLRDRQNHRFAVTYRLSNREEEILGYVLRGYSVPAIRNELSIAKSTIDTYIQRIYHKCDVHTRQELIELASRGRTQP